MSNDNLNRVSRKNKKVYYLPPEVKKAVKAIKWSSPEHYNAAKNLIGAICSKATREQLPKHEFSSISRNYMRTLINTNYYSVKSVLVEHGILEVEKNTYTYIKDGKQIETTTTFTLPKVVNGVKEQGYSQRSRINPSLATGSDIVEVVATKKEIVKKLSYVEHRSKKNLEKLTLKCKGLKRIKKFVKANMATPEARQEVIDKIKEVEVLPDSAYFLFDGVGKDLSKEEIRPYLKNYGLKIFSYTNNLKTNFYVSTLEQLVRWKLDENTFIYITQLRGLENDIRTSRNKTNNRLDTSITNLKSTYLGLFNLKGREGEKLNSFDLSNSQILFLATILKQSIKLYKDLLLNRELLPTQPQVETNFLYKSLNNNDLQDKENLTKRLHFEPQTMSFLSFLSFLKESGIYKEIINYRLTYYTLLYLCSLNQRNVDVSRVIADLEYFIDLAFSGKTYEYIAKEKKIKRGQAKGAMFTFLFGYTWTKNDSKEIIKNTFPAFFELCEGIKKHHGKDLRELMKSDHKKFRKEIEILNPKVLKKKIKTDILAETVACNYFSNALSRTESRLFIDNILTKLFKKNIFSTSKHDSILFFENDAKEVKKIMTKELDKFFGEGNYKLRREQYDYKNGQLITKEVKEIEEEAAPVQRSLNDATTMLDATKEVYQSYTGTVIKWNDANEDELKNLVRKIYKQIGIYLKSKGKRNVVIDRELLLKSFAVFLHKMPEKWDNKPIEVLRKNFETINDEILINNLF